MSFMSKTTPAYTRNTKPQEATPLPTRVVRLLSEARWFGVAALAVYLIGSGLDAVGGSAET